MKSQRGISPLIATVLLLGFAVALGAIVSTFLIKQAKEFKPESFLEDSPYCETMVLEPVIVTGVDPTLTITQPWPRTTKFFETAFSGPTDRASDDSFFSTTDPLRGGCDTSIDPECSIQGIGFRNKGSFNLYSIRVSSEGTPDQVYIPQKDFSGTLTSTSILPGKIWGSILTTATGGTVTSRIRNPAILYKPTLMTDSLTTIFKITPQVNDPEKAQKLHKDVAIISCSKQQITFDLRKVCPECYCPNCHSSIDDLKCKSCP